ncbi:MAG: Hsp33 family molecular chaperone HslO [Negativicutes bacterium]|jgi:molecular chaperone Hsp33
MNDYILRVSCDGLVVFAGSLPKVCNEASYRHSCSPTAAAALGRTMIATALYAETMKNDENISVRISGDGPLGNIIATADADGNIRGYAQHADMNIAPLAPGKLNVGGLVGSGGNIYVSRYSPSTGKTFTGAAELVNGEIGDDFANYLHKSEQIASAVGLGVWINPDNTITTAGGFLVMALPGCSEHILEILESNIAKMCGVTDILLSANNSVQALIKALLMGINYHITATKNVHFKCNCDDQRIKLVLNSLSTDDLEHLLATDDTEMICHFCNEKYIVAREDIIKIIASK